LQLCIFKQFSLELTLQTNSNFIKPITFLTGTSRIYILNKKIHILLTGLTFLGIVIIGIELNFGSAAIESYTKNDVIGNLTYSEWGDKYWQWWMTVPDKYVPGSDNPELNGGCLVKADAQNKTIFLTFNFYTGSVQQKCTIKADQSILIPLYTGECDTGDKENVLLKFTGLLNCALDADKGDAKMNVKVDNITLVDTKASVHRTPLHNNLTEVESKDLFDVNVPKDSQWITKDYVGPGNYTAAAHGWFVFLKPLDEGKHVIYYHTVVTGTQGADLTAPKWDYDGDVTYSLKVDK
jgi:hypothetical protein